MPALPYQHVAGLFFNTPLLLAPANGDTIGAYLFRRMDLRGGPATLADRESEQMQLFRPVEKADGSVEVHSPRLSRFVGEYRVDAEGHPLPYRMTRDGVAIITIIGELVNRGAWIGASSGLVSYEGLTHQLRTAARDPDVRAVVLDLNCPGGEAIGCFEAAAVVRDVRAVKPVLSAVNGMALSGGYCLASGSSRIISLPSGRSGSVGVILVHLDVSEMLKREGVRPTMIIAGSHKADGNPYEALPEDVRGRLQASVEKTYAKFIATVAAGRPQISEAAIRETEADIFDGDDALRLGLVDALGTSEEVLIEAGRLGRAPVSVMVPASIGAGVKAGTNLPAKPAKRLEAAMEKCANASCGHPSSDHPDGGACTVEGCGCTSYEAGAPASDSSANAKAGAGNATLTEQQLREQLAALQRQNEQLQSERATEAQGRIRAEVKQFTAPLLGKTDLRFNAKEVELLGEGLLVAKVAAAGIGSVKLASGDTINAGDAKAVGAFFSTFIGRLADVAPNVVVTGELPGASKPPAVTSGVTADDFAQSAMNAQASQRIAAAVAARRATDPKFTREDLRREVCGE